MAKAKTKTPESLTPEERDIIHAQIEALKSDIALLDEYDTLKRRLSYLRNFCWDRPQAKPTETNFLNG